MAPSRLTEWLSSFQTMGVLSQILQKLSSEKSEKSEIFLFFGCGSESSQLIEIIFFVVESGGEFLWFDDAALGKVIEDLQKEVCILTAKSLADAPSSDVACCPFEVARACQRFDSECRACDP